jgi:hydroxyethylthiazole kinase-like uncharacterized protein yjeF
MNVVSIKEMVMLEEEAFHSGITPAALMEAAGEAMARRILTLYPQADSYLVLVGKGNNGGDGLVVGRHLAPIGKSVRIVLTASEYQYDSPETDLLMGIFPNLEVVTWRDDLDFPTSNGVVIDAMLGIHAHGALRERLAGIVAKVNAARAARFFRTVALDLPTGLAAFDETAVPKHRDEAIVADVTLAVGFAKVVLCREALAAWVGRLEVMPWSRELTASTSHQTLEARELAGLLPRRSALSHKGDFGRLVIVAGSSGFTGAPVLCAQAAQATGAGLLSVVTRAEAHAAVAAQAPPEAMVSAWPANGDVPEVIRQATAIVIGPGLGADVTTLKMLRAVLAIGCPVVIDADGLNVLAKHLDLLREAKGPVLLTPHPGEMTRLVGRKFEPDEREAAALAFVDHHHVTLVLKGTRTLIVARDQPVYVNTTGNPGLSTGGSGDTLAGILGALLAQGLSPVDAARLGVWLHGHAADLVLAERGCEEGLTPSMLSAHLGAALVSLRAQAVPGDGLLERTRR